jgi:hypothetical protein
MLDLTATAAPLTGAPCVTAEATAVSAETTTTAEQSTQTRTRVTAYAPTRASRLRKPDFLGFSATVTTRTGLVRLA